MRDTLEVLENDAGAIRAFREDSETRVKQFFVRADKDIEELIHEHQRQREEVVGIYVVGLHKFNRAKARPMFKTDAKFLASFF